MEQFASLNNISLEMLVGGKKEKRFLDEIFPHGYKVIEGINSPKAKMNCAGYVFNYFFPKEFGIDSDIDPTDFFNKPDYFRLVDQYSIDNIPDIEKITNKHVVAFGEKIINSEKEQIHITHTALIIETDKIQKVCRQKLGTGISAIIEVDQLHDLATEEKTRNCATHMFVFKAIK